LKNKWASDSGCELGDLCELGENLSGKPESLTRSRKISNKDHQGHQGHNRRFFTIKEPAAIGRLSLHPFNPSVISHQPFDFCIGSQTGGIFGQSVYEATRLLFT
jgi:hypothetical protein